MFKKQEINNHIFPRLKKESYLHRRKLRDYVLRFSKNVLPGKKVLDFGCGNKPYSRFFSTKHYFGIDGSLKSKADIIALDDLPIKDNSYGLRNVLSGLGARTQPTQSYWRVL